MANHILSVKDLLDGLARQRSDIAEADIRAYIDSKSTRDLEDELRPTIVKAQPGNYFRRIAALEILLNRVEKNWSELLVELSNDPDPIVRCWVLEQFPHQVEKKRCFQVLVEALQHDPQATIRSVAAESLGLLGDTRATPFLRAAALDDHELNDQGFSVSDVANESLQKLLSSSGV